MDWSDKEQVSAYNKKYQAEHKEQVAAQRKKFRETHKEKQAVDIKKWKQNHREHIRAYNRTWYRKTSRRKRSEGYKEKMREYYKRFPGRYRSIEKVNRAIRSGILIRPEKCPKCGRKAKIMAHHTDYSKPLSVVWLCGSCHRLEHNALHNEKVRSENG